MAVQYKTQEGETAQQTAPIVTRKKGGFVICHFSHAADLLFGIDALQSFKIPIHEVYTPVRIDGLKTKLQIRNIKTGYTVLKYGCFGAVSLSSILFYLINRDWSTALSGKDLLSMGLATIFLMIASIAASWLFTNEPPKIIKQPKADYRFLIVVKTSNIILDDNIASFLEYSGSVEISRAVKRMLIP